MTILIDTELMVQGLGLRNAELLLYALIYSYSQNGQGCFFGGRNYAAKNIGMDESTVKRSLRALEEKGLIRQVGINQTFRTNEYCITPLEEGVQNDPRGAKCPLEGGKMTPNNKSNINIYTKKEYYKKESFVSDLISLGISEQVASDWAKVRDKKGGVFTLTAFQGIAAEIGKLTAKGVSADDCAKLAVRKNWLGFEADWYYNELSRAAAGKQGPTPNPLPNDKVNDFRDVDYGESYL